jgi:hypothetical protein
LMARAAVLMLTPATAATSRIVGRRAGVSVARKRP